MFMKIKSIKFFSFILAAVILVTVAMIIPTSAEDLPSLYVTQINQKSFTQAEQFLRRRLTVPIPLSPARATSDGPSKLSANGQAKQAFTN
jgi:hypothetical protein